MNHLIMAIASLGVVAGAAVFVLTVAQLTCEHASAGKIQRVTTTAMGVLAVFSGIDCWDYLAGTDSDLEFLAVGFTIALSLSWGYRRVFRVMTAEPAARAATAGDLVESDPKA